MQHIAAPLVGFDTVVPIETMLGELNPNYHARPTKRFAIRYLRYWFIRNVLERLNRELGRPIRVLEVGIGYGKMLAFMGGSQVEPGRHCLPPSIEVWDALSGQVDPRVLDRLSYSNFTQADLDREFELPADKYDAIIVLHVLEHLQGPEATLRRLLPYLRKGGVLMGGSPTMPSMLAGVHQRYLRRKYANKLGDIETHKHLSVITPRRIRHFAKQEGLATALMAGAFFLRWSKNPLEDYRWWIRANLAWGALFPALGGELYFALRRTNTLLAGFTLFATSLITLEAS